jgi:hypothetical protein
MEERIEARWTSEVELEPPSPAYQKREGEDGEQEGDEVVFNRDGGCETPVCRRGAAFSPVRVEAEKDLGGTEGRMEREVVVVVAERTTKRYAFLRLCSSPPFLTSSCLCSLPLHVLAVPFTLLFLFVSLTLFLLVLLSPVLGRLSGLRTLGLFDIVLENGTRVVLGPLGAYSHPPRRERIDTDHSSFAGACYPTAAILTEHYTCTLSTLTPLFPSLYTSLSLSSPSSASLSSSLPLSFPLYPTTLLVTVFLLGPGILLLFALAFPARPTSFLALTRQRTLVLSAACSGAAFVVGVAASLAQWVVLKKLVEAGGDINGVGSVKLGRSWTMMWVALGLQGGVAVAQGLVGYAWREGGAAVEETAKMGQYCR